MADEKKDSNNTSNPPNKDGATNSEKYGASSNKSADNEEMDKKVDEHIRNIEPEVEESENVQLIFTKEPEAEYAFSIWSADLYFHRKYQGTSFIIRYFFEIAIFFIFFVMIPLAALIVSNEDLNIDALYGGETSGFNLMMKRNMFIFLVYLIDLCNYACMEAFVPISAKFLKMLYLYESSTCWALIENIYAQRFYLQISATCIMAFILSNKMFRPYAPPQLSFHDLRNILKTLLLWLGLYAGMIFLTKFITRICTFQVRRAGYKRTIFSLNTKSFIFVKLKMLGDASSKGEDLDTIINKVNPTYDNGLHVKYRDPMFDSAEMASADANNIYVLLNIKELDLEMIKKYFPEDYERTYEYFAGVDPAKNPDKKIKVKNFIKLAEELTQDRRDMEKTLRDQDSVFDKLDAIFTALISYAAIILLILLFGANYKVFMASVGTSLFTFSWIFADTIKTIFNCFVFLLIIRPYNCGDKVVVEDKTYYVYKIDLLNTTFMTPFNEIVYVSNIKLFATDIHNIARSPPQTETIEILIEGATTYEKAVKAGEIAAETLKQEKMFFDDCKFRKIIDGKIYYEIKHTKNFQNSKDLRTKRNIVITAFKDALGKAGVPHKEAFEFVR